MKIQIGTIGAIFVIFVAVFIVIYVFTNSCKKDDVFEKAIDTLYRQCARWAVAADQDKSEIIAVLHANYAAGYLWAIKDIVDTEQFKKITGENFLDFEKKIVKIQDDATYRLVSICRMSAPISDTELLETIYGKHKN